MHCMKVFGLLQPLAFFAETVGKLLFLAMAPPTTEIFRAKRVGQTLPFALLTQVRGDWKMMKDVLGLPAHNESLGICFLRPGKPREIQEVSETAAWSGLTCRGAGKKTDTSVLLGILQIFPWQSYD